MQEEKKQTVLERKQQMGHLITCCPAFIRGGVEDTRLEAKDTKKKPRPRTAFPRTDTLEAKDEGHKRKCSRKKKSLHKNFQAISTKNVFQKIFQALHKILTI